MDTDVRSLNLDDYEAGLQLAEDVLGGSGQVLVEAPPQPLAANEIHERLAKQFSGVIDDPLMPELMAMFERFHQGGAP